MQYNPNNLSLIRRTELITQNNSTKNWPPYVFFDSHSHNIYKPLSSLLLLLVFFSLTLFLIHIEKHRHTHTSSFLMRDFIGVASDIIRLHRVTANSQIVWITIALLPLPLFSLSLRYDIHNSTLWLLFSEVVSVCCNGKLPCWRVRPHLSVGRFPAPGMVSLLLS